MKKLNLNKEVIATLNDDSMNHLVGGEVRATPVGCQSMDETYCKVTCQCPPVVATVELSNCPLCNPTLIV